MNFFIKAGLFVVFLLLIVSYILPQRQKPHYSADELREVALSRNLASIPKDYKQLLKFVDSSKNRLTKAKILLGKELYFEKILSQNKDFSCASCHVISKQRDDKTIYLDALTNKKNDKSDCVVCHLSDQSATDRFEFSVGSNNMPHPFRLNTLTTLNAALAKYQTWDGSVDTIEEQVSLSIQTPHKMNLAAKEVKERLEKSQKYVALFNDVFDEINLKNVSLAIGAYLKTLLTRGDYDKFLDGDNSAISQEAKNGLANFINFGCSGCHAGITVGGQSIQKFPVRAYNSIIDVTNSFKSSGRETGSFGFNDGIYHSFPFENRGGFMGKNGEQLFRVPMLRNVTKTSPYFHNGSVSKLRDAIFLMAKHQLGMSLTQTQIDEIVAFLKTLEGDIVDYNVQKGEL